MSIKSDSYDMIHDSSEHLYIRIKATYKAKLWFMFAYFLPKNCAASIQM